jgi:hypothetical protein
MNPPVDPFEELADLFLTDSDEPAPPDPDGREGEGDGDTPARTAEVELAVVGSLPVRATLWLAPYVDAVAREAGPTGLIRLDHEAATLQILGPGRHPAVQQWPSLAEAIAALAGRVARWVIRPALEVTPGDLAAAGCRRITILSSANEGAIVDAYQRVKALVEAARATGSGRPVVGLAVLGAQRPRAERMQQQLSRTTKTFLEVEVPLVACVQRMDATIRATECLTFAQEPKPPLRWVLRWLRDATAAVAPDVPAEVEPSPQVQTTVAPADLQAVGGTDLAGASWSEPEPSCAVKLGPKAGAEVEPKEPAVAAEPDEEGVPVPLAVHIDEVTPLEVRCPGHERLELGVDAAGRLHVIARHEQLRELHVVEAWARAHRELIARACPEHWIDPAAGTVCHVFTDEPAAVADLHGSALRLHVLAPVFVDGRQGWYAAPLNAAIR